MRRSWRFSPPQAPGAPLADAPEMAVEAAAAAGALNGEHVVEIARWYLPEAMLRHEGGADAAPGIAPGPGHGALASTASVSGPRRPPCPPEALASHEACVSPVMDMNIDRISNLGNGLQSHLRCK